MDFGTAVHLITLFLIPTRYHSISHSRLHTRTAHAPRFRLICLLTYYKPCPLLLLHVDLMTLTFDILTSKVYPKLHIACAGSYLIFYVSAVIFDVDTRSNSINVNIGW